MGERKHEILASEVRVGDKLLTCEGAYELVRDGRGAAGRVVSVRYREPVMVWTTEAVSYFGRGR